MANTFSFEDALKPQASQGFSFEDAVSPAATEAFSFEDALGVQPRVEPELATPVVAEQAPTAQIETPTELPPVQPQPVQDTVQVATPPETPPATGMFDRVLNFLNQPVPVSAADMLIAGSLKKGVKQLAQVPAATTYAELSGLQAAREAQYGKNLENAPPEVKARHEETAKELARLQKDAALAGVERKEIEATYGINPLAKKLAEVSATPEYQQGSFWDKTKQYGSALLDNAKDIPGYIGTLGLESLPASTATIATAMLTRGLTRSNTLAAASAGGTSGFIEFGNNYADMREKGMSHEEAWEKAAIKSGVIGFFDAVSFGSAGKAANEVMKKVEQGAALAATKQTLKGSTIQGAYGAAGEGGGSAVIGEDLDPIKMGAEFAGEFFTAPIEGAGAYAGYKQAATPTASTGQLATEPQPTTSTENLQAMSDRYEAMVAEAEALPKGSQEYNDALQKAFDYFDNEVAPFLSTLPQETPVPQETPTPEDMVTSTAPGISVSYPRERAEPTLTVDPETGEVITPAAEEVQPTVTDPEVVQQRAIELRQINGYPVDVALSVARREYAEGDLNVEPTPSERQADEVVGDRVEPSISVPSEGGTTAEGTVPSDIDGLAPTVGVTGESVSGAREQRPALESEIPTLTERATPAQIAQTRLDNAEIAVAESTTPAEKKAATTERNKARQALKKIQATAPEVVEPAVVEPEIVEPTAPVLSQEDQLRLDGAQREAADAQQTLDFLAEQGFTTPEQHYGVESAQNKLAQAQEVINELAPTPAPATIETPTVAPKKRGRPAKPVVEGAAPAAPKKRGRPSVKEQLTPEQLAYKEAERQQNQEDLIKAARGVNKAIKIAEAIPQEAKYRTPEEFEMAKVAAASARKTALYTLHQAATSPAYRKVKTSGIKAAEYLASDAVTPKERADLQTRIEFEKTRGPKPSAARRRSTEKADPAFSEFKNATQAAEYIAKNGTPFERALASRLKPFLSNVRLAVADTQQETPEAIQELLGDASGVYSSRRWGDKVYRMIVLRGENFDDPALQGVNNTIFLHEALHAATEAKIDEWQELTSLGMPVPRQLQTLMNDLFEVMGAAQARYEETKASGEPVSPNLRHKFEKLDITNDPKEFVAYGMTDPDIQQFLLNTPGYTRKDQALGYIKNLFNKFVNSIRRSFNMDAKHQSGLQDLVLVTEGLMQEQEIEPAYSVNTVLEAKEEKVDKNLEKIRLSNTVDGLVDPIEQNVPAGHTYNDFNSLMKARFDAMGTGFISKTLATLQTADIVRWQGDAIPALKSIDTLVEKMAGSRMNMERAFARKADKFAAFIRKVGKKKVLLSNAMHLARLNSVSPSTYKDRADALATDKRMVELDKLLTNPATPQEELQVITRKRTVRAGQINQTFDAWEQLGTLKGGQDMYRMVRQFYKDANVLTRTLLDERIERLNIDGEIDDPSTPKGKLMLAVRRMQEGSDFRGIDEYFPFMRYGNFWLRVNGPQGREFYLFENGTERNAFLTRRAAELGVDPNTDTETFDAGDDITALRTKYSPESRMLADMFETIDNETDKPGFDKDSLKDALYQTYLMTLPEESYRKQFLHAENVTGFSSDVFRNFTTSASRIASQAAKLAYGDRISDEIQRARDTLAGMPALRRAKLGLFVNEMQKRVGDELDPPIESKAVTRINQFAYYSLLTGVASAITQTTALPMLVMPVLNQQYGYGQSAAKLAKYMSVWQSVGITQEGADGETIYTAPSVGSSRAVKSNPLLQRAFQEAVERGLTAQTNSSVLANTQRTPDNAYQNIPGLAARTAATAMSALFTGAERMTREVAYMMAFELEYAKTKDFDGAVQKAVDTVQELLGRYDSFNRPTVMRNVVGRTVGQFKMYAVNITSFFVRNAYAMFTEVFKGNPKESLAAMHRLTGVLAMAAVFGGVTSFPMYSLVTSVIDLILDNLGDDEEKKRRMAENPYTSNSSDLRFRYEFLPRMFGDIKITGLDGKERRLSSVLEKGVISELGDFNIGSRTSYDGMWFRDAKPGNTTQETVTNYIIANLGPAVSSGLSMTGAVDDFKDGKIMRGLERIMPALLKNPLTAARLAKEGAKTPGGEIVMDKSEFSSFNIAMQALGFQPTTLTRFQENKFKLQQEVVAATKARSDILGKLDNAILDSDSSDAAVERIFDRIDKHNDRYAGLKQLRIDGDTIRRVLDKAKDRDRYMFRGMYIRKEDLPYLLELRDTAEKPQ